MTTESSVLASLRREPVRLYLYGVLVAGEALAAAYGLVTATLGALWLGLGAAILVVPATELARANVTPTAAPHTDDGRPAQLVPVAPPEDDDDLLPPPGGSWVN